jgi:TonB family protein
VRKFATMLWLALSFATPVALAQVQKPLTKTQVDDLVTSGLDSGSIAKVVSERGIDFQPTDRYIDILRSEGAMQVLIDALRAATPAPMSKAQLLHALAGGTPQDDLAAMVERRGIDFKPTSEDLDTLRIAGAGDKLYQAVVRARQSVSASSQDPGLKGGTIYAVGGDVMAPVPVYHPNPAYSDEARRAKYSGVVQLTIVVDANGDVTDAKLDKPIGYGLDQKSIETVKTWKFKPATRNGTPVPVRLITEVTFRLY